ncbi:MAG: hypothetical protein IIC33_01635 [Chloroflexi bacterium]|nr:hypothetical protein [Chloroflexota bacterium]
MISGILGGFVVSAYITHLVFARFHRIALLNERYDVQTDVLIVLAVGPSLLAIPMGIALGVLAAAAANQCFLLLRRERPGLSNTVDEPQEKGASWVTRRNEAGKDEA